MPEEKPVEETVETPLAEEALKPPVTEEISPKISSEKKEKRWLKPVLFSVSGIVLAAGLVFLGYQLAQKKVLPPLGEEPTPTLFPTVTPSAEGYRIVGVDLTIDKVLRVARESDKDLLVLTATFAANVECPLTGGAACGYDTRGFRLVDEEGFVQDQLFSYPKIKYLTTNPISQRTLKLGEKDRGEVFFEIPKDRNKFFLTYSSAGETSEKFLIEPELFDPTTNWKIYTSQEFGYLIKYPPDFTFRDFSNNDSHQVEFSGVELKVIIRVKEEKESPYYLDQELSAQIEVGGVGAKLYQFPEGYCDAGGCTQPFIAAVFYRNNLKYILEFYGSIQLTETANLMLSSFEFLD